VLVGVDDVEAGVGEEPADRGDQPRAVRTGQQQAGCGVLGDNPIIAVFGCKGRFIFRPARKLPCLEQLQ
jgi:hypothetical protein